jgi:hypothetical protein
MAGAFGFKAGKYALSPPSAMLPLLRVAPHLLEQNIDIRVIQSLPPCRRVFCWDMPS